MPEVNVRVAHDLQREEAIERLQRYSQEMRGSFSTHVSEIEEVWTDDGQATFSFRAMGMTVSGTTIADHAQVHVSVKLPFAALPFRGMLEKEISERVQQALA